MMDHVQNPSYFHTPQTTYGVQRRGMIMNPTGAPIQRYRPMGTLSVDGRIIPAPIHSALSGVALGAPEEATSQWKTYAMYAGGGVALGAGIYFLAKKMGWM